MRILLWFIGALLQACGISIAILKNDICVLPILFTLWIICIYSYLHEAYNETPKDPCI